MKVSVAAVRSLLWTVRHGSRLDADMAEEFRRHVEMRTADLVGLMACWLPARSAMWVDPGEILSGD